MNNNNTTSIKNEITIPVGNSGFYSEFLIGSHGSKAYIKTSFSAKKIYYSEIEKAQASYREYEEHVFNSGVLVDETILQENTNRTMLPTESLSTRQSRTSITIAELLNPVES